MLKPSNKILKAKNKKQWVTASAIISFILVLIGVATLILIQKPIKESQDLRQQASVSDGQVQMSFSPGNNNTLNVNQEAQITYQVTTNNVQVDGLQLVFNVVTDTLGTAPDFVLTDTANLQIAYQQAEQVSDGYLVSVILIGDQIASPVSYASPTSIGHLSFTPQSTGTIEINFDVENSLSTIFNTNPPQDQLNNISTLSYSVVDPSQPSASPSTSPSPSVGVSPSPTSTISPSPSASPNTSPSPSPDATIDPGNGTGGNTTVSCNQSCSSNNECEANHRCYNNQCRLVTNVSSSSCAAPSTADAGINRSCNEYCADNRECGYGYNCYFNRCRNPLNLDSTSCAAPSQQVAAATFASCNQGCSTHKDCAANLLCNSTSNTCRLATNPSSTTCTPATRTTVSNIYSGASKSGSSTTKGASGSTNTGGTTNTTGSTTGGQTASPVASSTPSPTATPSTTVTRTETEDSLPIKDQTALGALFSYFQVQLAERNISLPVFFVILGILLLIIVFIISMLLRFLGGGGHQSPIITPVGADRDRKKDTQYENKLAEKINTLQQTQNATQKPQPLPTDKPAHPVQPMAAAPSQMVPPPQAAVSRPAPMPQMPQSSQPAQSAGSNSNMMDRLKNKGVSTPNNPEVTK